MPQTPHVEKHFTASEYVRDIVIGMSVGGDHQGQGTKGEAVNNRILALDEMTSR